MIPKAIFSRVKDKRNLSPILRSTVWVMRWIGSLKVELLTLNRTILISSSMITIKTSSLLIIIIFTFNFAMNQCSFLDFDRFFTKLSNVDCEPFLFRIFLWIHILNLVLLWLFITDYPLDLDLYIFLIEASKHTESKKENIS